MAIQSAREFAREIDWLMTGPGPSQNIRLLHAITARDDAIRAEEREACAKIADDRGWDRTAADIRACASSSATQPEPTKECLHAGYGATYRDGGPHAYCNNCGVRVT